MVTSTAVLEDHDPHRILAFCPTFIDHRNCWHPVQAVDSSVPDRGLAIIAIGWPKAVWGCRGKRGHHVHGDFLCWSVFRPIRLFVSSHTCAVGLVPSGKKCML